MKVTSSVQQASVRTLKLCSATLCTGVYLFFIKRHQGVILHTHSPHCQ